MSNTASPSLGSAAGRVAKVIRVLEQAGVTDDDFQQIIDDRDFRLRAVRGIKPARLFTVAPNPNWHGLNAMLCNMFDDREERELIDFYTDPARVRDLMSLLSPQTQSMIVMSYNLDNQRGPYPEEVRGKRYPPLEPPVTPVDTVAYHHGCDSYDMVRIRDGAMVLLASHARELARQMAAIQRGEGSTPIGVLGLPHRVEEILNRNWFISIQQLVQLTSDEALALTGVGPKVLEEIQAALTFRGLAFKDALDGRS